MEIDLSKPILDRNERLAAENRARFDAAGVFVLDLMASPGAGKTSTILATIAALRDRYRIAVIEGDIASKVDAEKVKAHGIPAVQINTGGACHLESDMIKRAVDALPLEELDLIIIENVGNLVCPTDFNLGENAEGHDSFRARGPRQAVQVPGHLPGLRGGHPQQGDEIFRQTSANRLNSSIASSFVSAPTSTTSHLQMAGLYRPNYSLIALTYRSADRRTAALASSTSVSHQPP